MGKSKNKKQFNLNAKSDSFNVIKNQATQKLEYPDSFTNSVANTDENNVVYKDSSMFFHFLALTLTIMMFSFGFGAVKVTLEKVFVELLQFPDRLALPSFLGLIGIGFLIGSFYWRRRKQTVFKIAAIALLILILVNTVLFFVPDLFRILTIFAVNSLNIDGQTIYALPAISSLFLVIYSVFAGFFISLMIPALSLIDTWHRERLKRKSIFVTPPAVCNNLALWAPFVFFLVILGYFIAKSVIRNSKFVSFQDSKPGMLISIIFLAISLAACLIYFLFKPKKVDIYENENYDLTTVGYKFLGWRSQFLAYLSSTLGITGSTTLFIIYFTQYDLILRFAQPDPDGIPLGFSILFLLGFAIGLVLLQRKISINLQIHLGLFCLILFCFSSTMAFHRIHQPTHEVFESTISFVGVVLGLLGFVFAVFIRSARAFFEVEVYKEGKILSRALGLGLLIGSIVSVFLIASVDSPFVLINYGFYFFAGCVILAVIIAPTGIWKARNKIMNLGVTYFEKDKSSLKSLMISLLWGIGLFALVIYFSYNIEAAQIEGYKFVQSHAIKQIGNDDKINSFEIDGKQKVFKKISDDYSLISLYLGLLDKSSINKNIALLTNNLDLINKLEKHNLDNFTLINPYAIAVNIDRSKIHLQPYLWSLSNREKNQYMHFDVNDETVEFIVNTGLIEVISNIENSNSQNLISFNFNLRNLSLESFVNTINEIAFYFKDLNAYYLPDTLILLNRNPEISIQIDTSNFDYANLQFPSTPSNMLKELSLWEIKVTEIKPIENIQTKNVNKVINSLIIDNFCEKDSIPYLSLKTLNSLIDNELDEAKELVINARNRYKELSFHEDNLQNETKFPIRAVYDEVQFKVYYQKALDSMEEANEAQSPMIRKNCLNDAMIWGQKAGDLKPENISAWILCYKAARMLDARDLLLFEKKIGELDEKILKTLQQEDFANK